VPEAGDNGILWLKPLILREKQRKVVFRLSITERLPVDI
jgi:hypothetical protein